MESIILYLDKNMASIIYKYRYNENKIDSVDLVQHIKI